MKFVFIVKHRNIWPVAWLCNAMGGHGRASMPG
jgi:putative transposase